MSIPRLLVHENLEVQVSGGPQEVRVRGLRVLLVSNCRNGCLKRQTPVGYCCLVVWRCCIMLYPLYIMIIHSSMHWLLGLTYICPVPYDKWDDDPRWLTSFKEVAQHGSTTKWYMCIHDHRSSILKHYWSCIYLLYIMCFFALWTMNIYEHWWTCMNMYEHLWTTLPCCSCFLARKLPVVVSLRRNPPAHWTCWLRLAWSELPSDPISAWGRNFW